MTLSLWNAYQGVYFYCENQQVLERILGFAECFIITGYNPLGEVVEESANKQLCSAIQAMGVEYQPLIGSDKDFDYQEPSYVVSCSALEAKRLATDFKQNAYYRLVKGQLWLICCLMRDEQGVPFADLKLGNIQPKLFIA